MPSWWRGHACCVNTVAKLMRDNDIRAKTARKFRVRTTDSDHDLPVADNRLDRRFDPPAANDVWRADITSIPTREGWLYLAAVEDLSARRVVGWAMAEHRESRLVVDALERAVQRRLPGEGLLSHSDRGSQYASAHYQALLARHGLVVSMSFILWSNVRRPIRRIVEKHLGGDVVHIELPNQVSFLNRAALALALDEVPPGGHVLLDARGTDYVDPDILDLIRDFQEKTGPARGVEVSLSGFRSKYQLEDQIQYIDYSTRDLQEAVTPAQVLQILKDGNERFRIGRQLTRDLGRQVEATAAGQHPLAVVLSCIDSRTPAELIFDLGVGDIFSVRLAGNVISREVLGSIEYACAVAGAKLVVVMGHTRCGAVKAAVDLICAGQSAAEATGCDHLDHIVEDVQRSVDRAACLAAAHLPAAEKETFVNGVARRNVDRGVEELQRQSRVLARLVREGRVAVAGAMYDVTTGAIEFLADEGIGFSQPVAS